MSGSEENLCYLGGCYCKSGAEAAQEALESGLGVRCGGGLPCQCGIGPVPENPNSPLQGPADVTEDGRLSAVGALPQSNEPPPPRHEEEEETGRDTPTFLETFGLRDSGTAQLLDDLTTSRLLDEAMVVEPPQVQTSTTTAPALPFDFPYSQHEISSAKPPSLPPLPDAAVLSRDAYAPAGVPSSAEASTSLPAIQPRYYKRRRSNLSTDDRSDPTMIATRQQVLPPDIQQTLDQAVLGAERPGELSLPPVSQSGAPHAETHATMMTPSMVAEVASAAASAVVATAMSPAAKREVAESTNTFHPLGTNTERGKTSISGGSSSFDRPRRNCGCKLGASQPCPCKCGSNCRCVDRDVEQAGLTMLEMSSCCGGRNAQNSAGQDVASDPVKALQAEIASQVRAAVQKEIELTFKIPDEGASVTQRTREKKPSGGKGCCSSSLGLSSAGPSSAGPSSAGPSSAVLSTSAPDGHIPAMSHEARKLRLAAEELSRELALHADSRSNCYSKQTVKSGDLDSELAIDGRRAPPSPSAPTKTPCTITKGHCNQPGAGQCESSKPCCSRGARTAPSDKRQSESSTESKCGSSAQTDEQQASKRTRVDDRERPFACSICPATFLFKQNRDRHVVEVHLGRRPHVCTVPGCNAAFKNSSGLKQHLSTVHKKERPFKCELCSSSFGQRNHLTQHIAAVHEGKRPFTCNVCQATFSNRGNLNQHRKRRGHHK